MRHLDYMIDDPQGHPSTAIEVKAIRRTSPEWAARVCRHYLGPGGLRPAEYFLLVTPDQLYLWHFPQERVDAGVEIPPAVVADARALLAPYFERIRPTPENISGSAFELVVGDWLSDLLYGLQYQGARPEIVPDWMTDSGWLSTIQRGHLDYQPAA